jgi:tRNA nucleotidyltransferase (CCA-adding enzyme)
MLSALPAPERHWLSQLQAEAARRGLELYLVGGSVRDLLLGRLVLDLDLVLEGDAIHFGRAVQARLGGALTVHDKFRTATWQTPDGLSLDLITARRETYPAPASLPEVTPSTLVEDLARRDFTINTLALRLADGALVDQHQAQADLRAGLIRVLHPLSFQDDPTRLYRAVRYAARYGFQIAPETRALVPAARPFVQALSPERIRHELDLVLDEPNAIQMLAELSELGLLRAVLDKLPWNSALATRLGAARRLPLPTGWNLTSPAAGIPLNRALTYLLWLLDLSPADLELVQKRLVFPLGLFKSLLAAATLRMALPALGGAAPSEWVKKLTGQPLLAVYALALVSGESALSSYLARWQFIQPQTTGETLKSLGLPPGPAYQTLLWQLRAAWLDGLVTSVAEETALLTRLLTRE